MLQELSVEKEIVVESGKIYMIKVELVTNLSVCFNAAENLF